MKTYSDDEMLELQAFLDGELSARQAKVWERRLKEDLDWKALAGELTWVKETIRVNEKVVPVPQSRDFYWSQISAGIEAEARRTQAAQRATAERTPLWKRLFLRWAVPVTLGVAALTFMVLPDRGGNGTSKVEKSVGLPKVSLALGHEFEVPMEAPTMVFRSEKDNMTVIWVETRLDY